MSHPYCRQPGFRFIVLLLLICCQAERINTIIVPQVTTTVPTLTNSQPRAAEQPKLAASYRLACSSKKPFIFERSSNTLKLYLLDAAGLYRFEDGDTNGIVKSHISTLPTRYEEARTLQILDIKLGEADYVLFVITTDQWHNVFLAYQSDGVGPASAQPIQRIKYSGNFSKAQLLECNGNIYMVTIVIYANTGKIRVYRWQQSYFFLESTKEVLSVDDVRCHCPSTLLLLALDYGQLPERSLNHVLLLDNAERPVKVQEMFFMYSSLPSFMLDDVLYLIRHVSKGTAQEHGFQTLNSCLHRLKQELNERKKWIDLIRVQLSRKNLLFDAITQSEPAKSTLIHPSVTLSSVLLPHNNPNLLPPSRTMLNGQSLLLRHYRVATDLNQVLLLNRERTEIQGDLHVSGFLLRSKMNVVPGTMQLDELVTQSVRVEQGNINHIAIPSRKVLSDAAEHGYRGHKVFRAVKSFRLNTHHLNGHPLSAEMIESGLKQLYTGKIIFNGSLRLKMANINAQNITLMGQSVTSKPYQQYLLRTGRQIISDPIAYHAAQFQYLFANTLNGVTLWQFSLTHRNWQNSFYLQDVAVHGHIRPARIAKRLHSVQHNRIDVNAHGTLRVTHLHTHSIDGTLAPEALWRKGIQYGTNSAAPKMLLGHTELRQSGLHIRGPLQTAGFNGRTSYDLAELAKPPLRRYHTMQLTAANATVATVQQMADLSLGEVLQRFVTTVHHHHGDGGTNLGTVPSFAKIVTPVRSQQIAIASVGRINFCPVQRLLQETVPKHGRPGRPIGGYKHVLGAVNIPKRLTVDQINAHDTAQLAHIVTRGPNVLPQTIDARWRFGAVTTGYLTAKLINRTPLVRLALRSEETLVLQSELLIERLQVTGLQLPKHPNWLFDPSTTPSSLLHIPHSLTRLRCHGSIHSHIHDPVHLLNQLLLTPSLDQTRTITSGLVFAGQSVHFGNCSTPPAAGGTIHRIERTARQCLRRNPSPDLRTPIVFEHDQVLLQTGPDVLSLRGNLKVAATGYLNAHTIAEVNVAERLGPTADLYRLVPRELHLPIVGEKRFSPEIAVTVHNVTLVPGPTENTFWSRLALCNHPTQFVCPSSLHFEQSSLVVGELLATDQLNAVPLEGFFHAFVKRQSSPMHQSKLHHIQDVPGTLTVSELHLTGTTTIMHHINNIPLTELVLHSTINATHQIVPGAKTFRALHIDGPLS
uniref:VWFD domain-containing protein n=1 Tax=Anopheles maculatus TaxID=74869 RepID=A0A182T4R1_9DIPT